MSLCHVRGAQFSGGAWFDGAWFTGDARFDLTQFTGHPDFHQVQFAGAVPPQVAVYLRPEVSDDGVVEGTDQPGPIDGDENARESAPQIG